MSSEGPDISAIVISYDGSRFISQCLSTLLADLRGSDHEVIVIDNASSDDTVSIIEDDFPSVRVIVNELNIGFAPAVNIGFREGRGRYYLILNQDLRFRPGAIPVLYERAERDLTIGMIGPRFVDFEGRLQHSARALPRYRHVWYRLLLLDRLFSRSREFGGWQMGWFDHAHERLVDQPMGAVMLIPRRVVEQVGEMDESFPLYMNDVDYCRRIARAGYGLLYCPEAAVEHYVGGSTERRPYRSIVESHRSMYRYFRKYARPAGLPGLWLTGGMLALGTLPRIAGRFLRRRLKPRSAD